MPAESVEVSTTIKAKPQNVYAMVSDVTRMGEWSPENTGGRWLGGATEARPGASFIGTNRKGWRRWSSKCTIVTAEPGKEISWDVRMFGRPIANWRYEFQASDAQSTLVTERFEDRRGRVYETLGNLTSGVDDRSGHNRSNMMTTLERLKKAAETA